MSKATKVKHVHREVLEEFTLPEGEQTIVKVLAGRGNNLHEVVNENNELFLASMPTKFRRNVWVKRGDFVVVEPISEGDKVKAEIIAILYKEQIKFIKEEGKWPNGFSNDGMKNNSHVVSSRTASQVTAAGSTASVDEGAHGDTSLRSDDEEDNDDDLFVNTNRVQVVYDESEEEDSDEESEDEEEEEGDDSDKEAVSSPDKNSVCSDGE